MTIDEKTRDEKLQYDINRKVVKISALSSGKLDESEYLMGEKILPSNRSQIIAKARFTYSSLGKALEKQTEKKLEALKYINLSNKTVELK